MLPAQKVGVVLSGGGPRGVTHVGVLKALEENNIPIDYIVGTSMGAIVGGLYAAGYSPEEIQYLISSDEMLNWVSGTMQSRNGYLFKKSEPNASWQIFKITYDTVFKAKLPTTIISPVELDFGFLKLFSGASAAADYNFDSLYVPFRCMVADIVDNKELTFHSGPLEKAVRASMTFPFYFKPLKINGKLMFDGGMYNNFPVDILNEEFNPDIVIGSKAASNYGPPSDNDIISQVQSMLMAPTTYTVDTTNGILITPRLWSVNIRDFSNTSAFIDSGYVATIRQMDHIKKLVKRRVYLWERQKKRREFREKIPRMKFNDIIILGVKDKQVQYINRLIKKKKLLEEINTDNISSGKALDLINRAYQKILAEKMIDYVYPELHYNESTQSYDMIFNISKSNMLEMEVGGLVSSRSINEIFFEMDYNRWAKNALNLSGNAYLGRFHNSAHLAARMDIPVSIPLAFELGYTVNGWNYFRTSTYFFDDDKPSYLVQQDNYWTLGISTPVSKPGKLEVRVEAGYLKDNYYQSNQFTRLDTTDVTFFNFYSPSLNFELNRLNRKQYATEGYDLELSGRFISGQEHSIPGSTSRDKEEFKKYHQWFQLRFHIEDYLNRRGAVRIGLLGEAAITNKDLFNNYTSTILAAPAFEPLPESQTIFLQQYRAHNFAAAGLKLIFPVARNLDFRTEGYAFQPFREILKNQQTEKAELSKYFVRQYYILSGRLVYHAPFGPISASFDYYEGAEEPYVFNIAIGYYIFNRRPFR